MVTDNNCQNSASRHGLRSNFARPGSRPVGEQMEEGLQWLGRVGPPEGIISNILILTPLQKLPNNVVNLGKIIVATSFEWLT